MMNETMNIIMYRCDETVIRFIYSSFLMIYTSHDDLLTGLLCWVTSDHNKHIFKGNMLK